MCDCDCDPPDFYNHATRRTRKERRCGECRRMIAVGEPYEDITGKWDGDFCRFVMCQHCEAGRLVVEVVRRDGCFCLGSLWRGIEDDERDRAWGTTMDRRIIRLIVAARRKWTVRRGGRKGELMGVPMVQAQETASCQ